PSVRQRFSPIRRALWTADELTPVVREDQRPVPVDQVEFIEVKRSGWTPVAVYGGQQVEEVNIHVPLGLVDRPVFVAPGTPPLERGVVSSVGPLGAVVEQPVVGLVPLPIQ